MRRVWAGMVLGCLLLLGGPACNAQANEAPPLYRRTEDVIYGRKFGMALTMDVFTPTKNANGAGVVFVVSGGWYSAHEAINVASVSELVKRGYTVFAVIHGSQPKYTIPEILSDMHRALRFIRFHAGKYGIDPQRIGITGGSAGGHLSLMQGMAGAAGADKPGLSDPAAKDPVDRVSSRVQAVACFFPPTDFLNYGQAGNEIRARGVLGILRDFRAPFDFNEFDPSTKTFVPIMDATRAREVTRQISPVYHVTRDDPPTLIIHGDADTLVPLQQSQLMIAKLKETGIPAELVVKPGAGHGWPKMNEDMATFAAWFDKHLKRTDKRQSAQ